MTDHTGDTAGDRAGRGSPSGRVPTNTRLLRILEIIARAGRPLTPTEINAELGLPKPSIHRLCATLVEQGFLAPAPDGRRLQPARRARDMASGVLFASRLHIARRQILIEVAREVRETVNFVVPEDDGMSYADRVETDWAFRVQLPIGTHVPFHCTASGKTFLAGLEPAARRRFVAALTLEPHTPNTITEARALLAELEAVAERDYAIDNEEFMEGMVAIAVPVRDRQGRFVAALAFHGPTMRLSFETLLAGREVLTRGAERLARAILDE